MKKLLIVAIFGIIAFISCGSETTIEDAMKDSARVYCEKIFTCEQGIAARPMLGGTEAKCRATILALSQEDQKDDPCQNFNASKADDCSTCTERLSCDETFSDDDDAANPCPACEQVCSN